MSLASTKAYELIPVSSTISTISSSDPPKTSILVLHPNAALFLLMKGKSESISTEILARGYAIYMPASEKSLLFSILRRGDGTNNVREACQHG